MAMHMDASLRARRAVPIRALERMANTGIYLVRGVTRDLQRSARVRAASEEVTLGRVLLQALREYAAGTWTPQPDSAPVPDPRARPDGSLARDDVKLAGAPDVGVPVS